MYALSIFVFVIQRVEAIRIIDSGVPFSVKVVKCDRKRKTGGEFEYYPKVEKLKGSNTVEKSESHTASPNGKRHPKHSDNATRNLTDLSNGRTVKIHIDLMTLFNGEEVVW
jgi:hypothetical protein